MALGFEQRLIFTLSSPPCSGRLSFVEPTSLFWGATFPGHSETLPQFYPRETENPSAAFSLSHQQNFLQLGVSAVSSFHGPVCIQIFFGGAAWKILACELNNCSEMPFKEAQAFQELLSVRMAHKGPGSRHRLGDKANAMCILEPTDSCSGSRSSGRIS